MTILNGIFIVLIVFCSFYHLRIIQVFVFKLFKYPDIKSTIQKNLKWKELIEKSGSHEKNQGNKNKIKQKVNTQKKKFFSVGNSFSNLRNASKDTGRMTGGKKMKEKNAGM